MELEKIEHYRGLYRLYPDKIITLTESIENSIKDKIVLEEIKQLAELCYLEGHRDGYKFSNWFTEQLD